MKSFPRVLITGAGGQLARALRERLDRAGWADRVLAPAHAALDVADGVQVASAVRRHRPDWIVNCAAYTAVDAAESERDAAFRVNDHAVGVLADAALGAGARLLHLSTDYVFDGLKAGPYLEADATHPLNVYGASKLAGEERLRAHGARWTILRTAWLYGEGGRGFPRRMLAKGREALAAGRPLPVVADQVGSPTDVHTLAEQIEAVMEADLAGLYHAAAEGAASWYEFAREVFSGLGLDVALEPITGEELGRPARRPPRVVLENRNLKAAGRERMIPWREGLAKVLERLKRSGVGD